MELYNMLRIIYLLHTSNRIMTANELSERLIIPKQTIRRLINKIDSVETGIHIEVIRGKNGGYRLTVHSFWTNSGLSDQELEAFISANEFLHEGSGYLLKEDFESGLEKLIAKKRSELIPTIGNDFNVIYKAYSEISATEKSTVDLLLKCIQQKRKIEISYFSLGRNKITKRIIHPYKVYVYNGANYIAAYCENRNEVRDFKISRIKEHKDINQYFEIMPSYDFNKFVQNTFGIFKDNAEKVKLKISYPYNHIVRENHYIHNQKINVIDDHTILFEAEMRSLTEVESWILSMGEYVEVLEPNSLKEKISERYEKIFKSYRI